MRTRHFTISLWILYAVGCGTADDSTMDARGEPMAERAFCGTSAAEMNLCPAPWIPQFSQVHRGAIWSVNSSNNLHIESGFGRSINSKAPMSWTPGNTITFDQTGPIKLFVRHGGSSGCPSTIQSRVYEVTEAYEPAAENPGSAAIHRDDERFVGWAQRILRVEYGRDVSRQYQMTEKALGPATGMAMDVVSLGEGGQITLSFDPPIADGSGPDFAIFENSFGDTFLEYAYVEVSSDGERYTRFPNAYLGTTPIGPFEVHEPELSRGLAGKYRAGFGTPFDLAELSWSEAAQAGQLNLHNITHVRLIDVVGDGDSLDSFGQPIYDPYPTRDAAGFDLDAVGILNTAQMAPCPDTPRRE